MAGDSIALDGASKRYGSHDALREVSFRIASGEAVGYLGPNGAGKTTTLRLLAGLVAPDSGSVRLLGLDPVKEHGRALGRVGVLVETPGVLPYVTARDLLEHVARVKRVAVAEERAQIRALSEELGFAAQIDRPIGTLSTGLTRRLLLAVALLGDPEVILLDEPTLGLDPAARTDLRRILRGLRREGRTILLSTHLLDDVEEVCSRVLFLRDGRIVGDEPVELRRVDEAGVPLRVLALRFSRDIEAAAVEAVLGDGAVVTVLGPRELRVEFSGDESQQSVRIARVAAAGFPILTATDGSPTLGQRYLERVGREDPA